jgi:hypothetical protein
MAVTATVTGEWSVALHTDSTKPGAWRRTRSGSPDQIVAETHDAEDRWAPLGAPVTYYWTDADGIQETAQVTVNPPGPVLSSALAPGFLVVTVVSQPPLQWEAQSRTHDILYRPDPVVTVAPARYHAATLRLYLPDAQTRREALDLLKRGEPLILRTLCTSAVDDVTMLPTSWSDPLVAESQRAGARWLDIDYQAVRDRPDSYLPLPAWKWVDFEAAHVSWTVAERAYPSWVEAEAGP